MNSIFHLFSALLLLAATFGYLNHKFLHLPRTVGMLIGALGLSVALILWDIAFPGYLVRPWAKMVLEQVSFPAALLNGLLSFLLFAAAMSVSFSDLWRRKGTIFILATVGVLISTFLMGGAMWAVFGLVGLNVPLTWCLVLGAIVAPTDPIAVSGALERIGLPAELRGIDRRREPAQRRRRRSDVYAAGRHCRRLVGRHQRRAFRAGCFFMKPSAARCSGLPAAISPTAPCVRSISTTSR